MPFFGWNEHQVFEARRDQDGDWIAHESLVRFPDTEHRDKLVRLVVNGLRHNGWEEIPQDEARS